MKNKWMTQLGVIIIAMLLFILTVNTCSAEKDYYSVTGFGLVVNDVPMLFDVESPTVVTMDDERDIVSIIASPERVYLYLITNILSKDSDSAFLGATFAAVDPNHNKYVINMRMYVDKTIQLTIMDDQGEAGFSLLLGAPEEHHGIQTRNDLIRRRILTEIQ